MAVGHAFGDGERLGCGRPQRELLVGHAVIGHEQRFGVFEPVFDVEQQFSVGGQRFGVERQHDGGALLRGDAQVGDDAATHGVPVAEHRPAQVAVVERSEEILIENRKRPQVLAERGPHGLLPVAGLVHVGIRNAVGRDQPVVAEIPVRGVVGVPVAAVAVDHGAVFTRFAQRLVHEVPDESALIVRILADQRPVFAESAQRIAHRMRVFALDQRFSGIVPEVFFALVVVPVHRTYDVRVAAAVVVDRAFVMDRPRGVVSLDPVVAGVEIGAVARLVAQRPDDDRRVVDVAPHVADVAFQMRLGVGGILGQCLFVVAHAVRFEVGLGHQIESVAVAERVPAGVVRVVARAHGVEIVLLEDADVLDHPLFRDDIPAVGVHFVAVRTFDQYRLPVH